MTMQRRVYAILLLLFGCGSGDTDSETTMEPDVQPQDARVTDVGLVVDAAPAPACGDGTLNRGESCDDGNNDDDDGCDRNCTVTGCGNGVVTPGEGCDDGNRNDGDGCDSNCRPTACGNGSVTEREICDDGNLDDGDGCDTNCTISACGNGVTASTEGCDDGNETEGDGCDSNCTVTRCGNGVQTRGEECDDGNDLSGDGCDTNCRPTGCGNGSVSGDEGCDDGNRADGDGCDNNCQVTGCGNGAVTVGEACDDGNEIDGDGCDTNCTPTICGNRRLTEGEVCDDGNVIDGDGCDSNCTATACGNGVQTAGEVCDDGNDVDGDGCDHNCAMTACGNQVVTEGEVCDDGNLVNGDGCDENCTVTACGNAVMAEDESCDDGNAIDGDGCDSNCRHTGCGNGILTDGEVCDDANLIEGDGCDSNCQRSGCGNGVISPGEVCDDGNLVDNDGCESDCRPTPNCEDQTTNGAESDKDCGGPLCTGCSAGRDCRDESDCESAICQEGICIHATCYDGQLNGREGDIDCGGWSGISTHLAVGGQSTCTLLVGDKLRCFGRNSSGQFGYGDTDDRDIDPNHIDQPDGTGLPDGSGPVVEVAMGPDFRCVLSRSGVIACTGSHAAFAPSISEVEDSATGDEPGETGRENTVFTPLDDPFTQIAAGADFVCALRTAGGIVCWGQNSVGQLGQGSPVDARDFADAQPVDLGAQQTATMVAAGGQTACAILQDGQLKCWGRNDRGQLGARQRENIGASADSMGDALLPVALGRGRTARHVSVGSDFACAILDDATAKCWGNNSAGQLGQGAPWITHGTGRNHMGDVLPPISIFGQAPIAHIAAGESHACAVSTEGQLGCWGHNANGQLGQNNQASLGLNPDDMSNLEPVQFMDQMRVSRVALGAAHSCAIGLDKRMLCWGSNDHGQLGQGDRLNRGHSALDAVIAVPPMDFGANCPLCPTDASCTARSQCASMLCRGGACRAPGCFDGIANAEESDTDCGGPLCASCPLGFSCLSHGDCGSGNCESVAGDDGPGSCIAARCNDGIQNAAETGVDCGGPACPACADTENCRVDQDCASARCEGNTCISCQDRIQNADETDVDCGGLSCDGCGAGFLCLDASDCASNQCEADLCISCDDSVLNGDESAMDCGGTHCPGCPAGERCRGVADCASGQCEDGACISCSDGLLNGDEVEVDCGGTLCGGCAPGQHCLENRDCISLVCEDRACRPATCFDGVLNGTEGDIDCGANQAVVEMVSTGTTHTCALLAGGHIKCFGSNDRGQLGLGDVESRMALGELGANLARLSLPTPAVSVYAGQQRTCMIGEDGNIYCWGDNRSGRLGLGHARDIGDEADEMGNHLVPVPLPTNARASHLCLGTGHTCALVDGGQVHCWGVNSRGQLGYDDRAMRGTTMEGMATVVPVALGQAAVAIGCGALFTCAHLMDGGIKCWGDSAQGQLGQEREFSLGDDPGEMASIPPINLGSERSALHVAVGSRHVCALLDDQSLKCWGQDAFGALGLEQLGDRGDDQAEMGDNLPAVALAETIRVAQLVAGDGTTCILTQSAQVFCWGQSGRYGTVGLETPDPVIRFHGPAHEPVEYTGQSPFIRLSLSSHHVCGRSAASTVHCWGWNDDGQLGTGNQRTMGRGAGDMVALAAAVPLGRGCDLCAQTSRCAEASQCQSGVCQNDICSGVGCGDGVQNGSETDQDCGGPDCGECPPSAACILNTDCSGGHCIENTCSTCGDRQQNGRETDIDCGGADCGPCSIGSACVSRFDCETFTCANVEGRQQCIERSCVDGILNGDESGMDCGGDCDPCPDGTPCRIPGDCASNLCTDLECTSCLDGIQNRSETSADCGGNDCAPCEAQRTCIRDLDCQSLICSDQTCAFSTCDDGVQNGVEGDVDCGGRTPIRAVSAGADHTCVIFAHGRVKCFGLNGNGNLGLGDDQAHGDDPLGMGDALQTVAIGGDRRIVAVEAGWTHTCALDEAGAVVLGRQQNRTIGARR